MFISEILTSRPVTEHGLLRAMGAGAPDLAAIHHLLANRRGMAAAEAGWTACMTGQAPDTAFEILLKRQRMDERATGLSGRQHGALLDRLLSDLEAAVGRIGYSRRALEAGDNWLRKTGQCFLDPSFAARLGALVATKHREEEFCLWLDIVLRRQRAIGGSRYRWLERRAALQADHAAEAENLLVIMATPAERREALRGARACDAGLWAFLDDIMQLRHRSLAA